MKIQLERSGKRIALALGLTLLVFGAQMCAGILEGVGMQSALMLAAMFGALAFVSVMVRIELKSWWSTVLGLGFTAVAGWFVMHWVLIVDRVISGRALMNNTLLSMVILLIGLAITARPKGLAIAWLVFCYGFGMVDTAVAQFRGNLIVLTDFLEVGTALSVAESYKMYFMPRMIPAALALVLSVLLVARTKVNWKRSGKLGSRLLSVALAVVCAAYPVMQLDTLTAKTWGVQGAYMRGILMEFLLEAKDMIIVPPEGYSSEKVDALAQEYESEVQEEEEKPHVIAIMAEAFTDLQAVGDFETSEDPMPFIHSLYERSTHGLALSSVFGGRTANSEWEFLTGNSTAFIPSGAMPYRQYAKENMNSLVAVLENKGYQTIGTHCYHRGGWNRHKVYPYMGFDETYFLDDLEWGETVRTLVSDRAFFQKIIEMYEQREEGKPLFLFGVTMMGHGGYPEKYSDVVTINVEGMSQEHPDLDQYLSLVKLTDAAMEELIAYFEAQDEKVAVVFFGDHMPKISNRFYAESGIGTGQKSYMVPWFIWKNYDETEKEIPLTSLNYLASILLEEMEMDAPAYFDFLSEARKVVPAINANGCVVDGKNAALDDLEGSALEMMEKYRILQHANLFDDAVSKSLFTGNAE